jgi:hypothetical protein
MSATAHISMVYSAILIALWRVECNESVLTRDEDAQDQWMFDTREDSYAFIGDTSVPIKRRKQGVRWSPSCVACRRRWSARRLR